MSAAFFIAFAGPVLLGLLGLGVLLVLDRTAAHEKPENSSTDVSATLAEAEMSARRVADAIAKVRGQIVAAGEPR